MKTWLFPIYNDFDFKKWYSPIFTAEKRLHELSELTLLNLEKQQDLQHY